MKKILLSLTVVGLLLATNPVLATTSTTSTPGEREEVRVEKKELIKKAKGEKKELADKVKTLKEEAAEKIKKLREENKAKQDKFSAARKELDAAKKAALDARKVAYKAAQEKYLAALKVALETRKAEYKAAQDKYLAALKAAQEKYNQSKNAPVVVAPVVTTTSTVSINTTTQ